MNIREFIIKKKREEASEILRWSALLYCIALIFLFVLYAILYSFVKDNAIYVVLVVGIILVTIFFMKAYPWHLNSYISSVEKGDFTYSFGTCKGVRVLIVEVNGSKSIYYVSDIPSSR